MPNPQSHETGSSATAAASADRLRLLPVNDAHWPPDLERLRTGFAGRLNVYRVMAHHPRLLSAWVELRNHLVTASELPPRWRELVILRTAHLTKSRYEWTHHVVRGRLAGLTLNEIAAAQAERPGDALEEIEGLLLAAVDQLHARSAVESEVLDALAERVGPRQLLDLMATVGMYLTLAFILNTFNTPLEAGLDGRA